MSLYLFVAVGVIALAVFLFLLYSGYFYRHAITRGVPNSLPRRFAYKIFIGPYENVGSAFKDLMSIAPNLTLFGCYYDDPDEVPNERLRSAIACCLPDDKTKEAKIEKLLEESGYNIETFPKCTDALITHHPFRNMLSILFATRKVYPSLIEHIKKHTETINRVGPFIEMYQGSMIEYIVVLEPTEGFYVSKLPPLSK
jgi:effector-binding domain-containing protein